MLVCTLLICDKVPEAQLLGLTFLPVNASWSAQVGLAPRLLEQLFLEISIAEASKVLHSNANLSSCTFLMPFRTPELYMTRHQEPNMLLCMAGRGRARSSSL